MNFLKSLLHNVYETVLQDQYIEQLTQQQLYFIINNSQKKKLSQSEQSRKMSITEPQKNLYQKIDIIGNVSPQRQFRILGMNPKLQVIAQRIKKLTQNLQQLKQLMMDNFQKYQKKIFYAINQITDLQNIQILKKYSQLQRQKLKKLQQATIKSKRITHLYIKKQNIKLIQKNLLQIPNIKKMNLTQLKSINIENFKHRSILKNLNCLKSIQNYVKNAVTKQLTQVLKILQQCITDQFEQKLYQNALRDFIIAQHQKIKYEKLLIKLIQKQIHKSDGELRGNINQLCQFYIKLIINLHGVIRWHRLNQSQLKWQQLSKGYYGISIQIDTNNVTKKVITIMDQCFKQTILQKFYHNSTKLSNNLQLLYLICRMSQIAYAFSGEYFKQTFKEITEYLYKGLLKIKQKSQAQLQQTLKNQQKNNWNRLPVVDDYSHEIVDKVLYQIYRHRQRQDYIKVIDLLHKSHQLFTSNKIPTTSIQSPNRTPKEPNQWQSSWTEEQPLQSSSLHILKTKQSGSSTSSQKTPNQHKQSNQLPHLRQRQISIQQHLLQQQQQQQTQTWQIEKIQFPQIQKYQKYKSQIKLKHKSQTNSTTIICQYSLNMLKYISTFISNSFYYPIQPLLSFTFNTISSTLQFYIYNVFNSFLSINLKYIFLTSHHTLQTTQQKYHNKRFHYLYPTITKFIINFKNTNKLSSKSNNINQNQYNGNSNKSNLNYHYTSFSAKQIGFNQQSNNSTNYKQNLIVRSRVVALQSFSYLIEYYQHIMKICGFYKPQQKLTKSSQKISEDKSSLPTPNQQHKPLTSISDLYPSISRKFNQKLSLYHQLIPQLSQLIYTDCIPKLCNLKITHELIQSIKWNDDQQSTHQYISTLTKTYSQFFYKMNSSNRGEVPLQIAQRFFGVYWKTQLTAIFKAFINQYKNNKYGTNNIQGNCKQKLQKFIDDLFLSINTLVQQKHYLTSPYQKIKTIFPILLQKSWQNTYQMIKSTVDKCQFIFAIQIGMVQISQSSINLSKDDLLQRKKKIQDAISLNLQNN